MAPPATSTAARRSTARTEPRSAPGASRRPPLRLFEPAPKRRSGPVRLRRSTMWLAGLLVIGSLLAVVAGDTLLTEGQVRLSATDQAIASAVAVQKAAQVAVAEKAAPPVVVSQAEAQGLVAPTQVVYLPQVPLDVPLPVPQTVATATAGVHPAAAPAATTGSSAPSATSAPASR